MQEKIALKETEVDTQKQYLDLVGEMLLFPCQLHYSILQKESDSIVPTAILAVSCKGTPKQGRGSFKLILQIVNIKHLNSVTLLLVFKANGTTSNFTQHRTSYKRAHEGGPRHASEVSDGAVARLEVNSLPQSL